jgi:hypothetical protein
MITVFDSFALILCISLPRAGWVSIRDRLSQPRVPTRARRGAHLKIVLDFEDGSRSGEIPHGIEAQ